MEPQMTEAELIEFAFAVVCNAGGGDWTKESPEWQASAARLRTHYHGWRAKWSLPVASDEPATVG